MTMEMSFENTKKTICRAKRAEIFLRVVKLCVKLKAFDWPLLRICEVIFRGVNKANQRGEGGFELLGGGQ